MESFPCTDAGLYNLRTESENINWRGQKSFSLHLIMLAHSETENKPATGADPLQIVQEIPVNSSVTISTHPRYLVSLQRVLVKGCLRGDIAVIGIGQFPVQGVAVNTLVVLVPKIHCRQSLAALASNQAIQHALLGKLAKCSHDRGQAYKIPTLKGHPAQSLYMILPLQKCEPAFEKKKNQSLVNQLTQTSYGLQIPSCHPS